MTEGPSSREWNAAAYHRLSGPQVSWGQKVLARLPLRGDELVLDAGCGTGRLTAEILERLPHGRVIAVDASENMLRLAREYLAPFGDRVQFVRANLQVLTVDEAVDMIVSTAAFHWILDHPRLFRHLYLALKPGGLLLAQCGGGPNLAALLSRVSVVMADEPYAQYFQGWSDPWEFADDRTTASRLQNAGFVDVETSLEPAPTVLRDVEEYREFLTTVIVRTHLDRLPDDELRRQFVDSLAEWAAEDDLPFSLDYWRLNMRGTRA